MLDSFTNKIKTKFKITQSDSLQKTLGFQIERTHKGCVFIIRSPFDPHVRLCKDGEVNVRTGMSSSILPIQQHRV